MNHDMFDEPKDIFAETEKPQLAQGGNPPVAQAQRSTNFPITPPPTQLPPSYAAMNQPSVIRPPEHKGSAVKIVVIVVVILIILGVSGVFAYQIMTQPASSDSVVNAVPSTGVSDTATPPVPEAPAPAPTPVAPVEPQAPVTQTQNPASLLDSDGDGLSNARELELGTSVTKADTDGDGLGDKEEVDVYGTNPRKVDTDGDGYLDGAEVAKGYNPNGPGKLFTVPTTSATPAGS